MPRLVVVAGVNGSGKSTLTQQKRFNKLRVIDPDAIAKQIAKSNSESARITAGRAALIQRNALMENKDSFVLETTLSGKDILRFMGRAKAMTYRIELHYVYLLDAAQSADRVATRVSRGGHDIPLPDIERRFNRSRTNFVIAAGLSDLVIAYDNASFDAPFEPVLYIEKDEIEIDQNSAEWLKKAALQIRDRSHSL